MPIDSKVSAAISAIGADQKAASAAQKLANEAILSVASRQDPYLFSKNDPFSPLFRKTGSTALVMEAGAAIRVGEKILNFGAVKTITNPAVGFVAGSDYYIYACDDLSVRSDISPIAPVGYTTERIRKIGGFHYGLVPAGTTLVGGSFATTGSGMIWTQADVDKIAGINQYSIWDLKFRPKCSDTRGLALVDNSLWWDIYLCSANPRDNGTSRYNSSVASGTALPTIPYPFGGAPGKSYPSLNWYVANEIAQAWEKRLPYQSEFATAMFGTTEGQSIGGTSVTIPTTGRSYGYTSKYGIEQATGHHFVHGQDSNFFSEVASPPASNKMITGNSALEGDTRGSIYTFGAVGLARVQLGGARLSGVHSGSRASFWGKSPDSSQYNTGLRCVCEHLISV